MQKNIIYLLFLGMIGLSVACTTNDVVDPYVTYENTMLQLQKDKGIKLTKSPSGIYYLKTKTDSLKRAPQAKDLVKLHYVKKDINGIVKDSSKTITEKAPQTFTYLTYDTEYNYMAEVLKENEAGVFYVPYTNGSIFIFEVRLISTRSETEQIDEFVKEKWVNLPILKTISGIQYVITKTSASGDAVVVGKNVTVAYTGKFLYQAKLTDTNGFPIYTDKFDSGSLSFVIGGGGIVAGFDEAAKLMKVGDKGIFIFPSSLGYGASGKGNIQPYTPLLFEMEITAVK
jgi:FKBP-type peptidyl-prolyl cis-trans isomerase